MNEIIDRATAKARGLPRLLAAAAYLNGVQGPPLKGSTKGE